MRFAQKRNGLVNSCRMILSLRKGTAQ